jgi:hypothetical protein
MFALAGAVAGAAVLFTRGSAFFLLAPIVGVIAGLGTRRWRLAIVVAGGALALGLVVTTFTANPAWAVNTTGLAQVLGVVAAACAIAGGTAALAATRSWAPRAFSAVAIALICAAMVASTFALDEKPDISGSYAGAPSATALQQLSADPVRGPQMSDEQLFLIWLNHLRSGDDYYATAARIFGETYSYRPVLVHSPFSYRPPTLYMLLAALPRSAVALVLAMMAACSLGVVFTYLLARQFAERAIALSVAMIAAAIFTGYGNMTLLEVERWAGIAVLGSVALFVIAVRRAEMNVWLMALSAGLALLAVCFRELVAPLLVLGLSATLATPAMRQAKAWAPWSVALVLAAVFLGAHWYSAARAFEAVVIDQPLTGWHRFWFHPDGSGLVGAMHFASDDADTIPLVSWALLAIGVAGSILAPLRLEGRFVLAGVALGGPVALFLAHPPGVAGTGTAPGYWVSMVFPVIVASVALAFSRLISAEQPEESSATQDAPRASGSYL